MSASTHTEPQASFLVLDYAKESETRACLISLRKHVKILHKIVLLDNGGTHALADSATAHTDYPWQLFEEGLCDTVIAKRAGGGGGRGQTDLFRWCDTPYAFFVQNDQVLVDDIDDKLFARMTTMLGSGGFRCIDLNGDQSNRGVWTDRAHLIETAFFNSLAPFPNGGPGNDAAKWNEQYLQETFAERGHRIAHLRPALFQDCGKWSVREAGDGLFRHRCDTKELFVLKQPTARTEIYPPLDSEEWSKMLSGQWIDGTIPKAWKNHSFRCWSD